MPSYQHAAVAALRKLRAGLADKYPGNPAVQRLDVYLERLAGPDFSADR
jgi:hypothetical protein